MTKPQKVTWGVLALLAVGVGAWDVALLTDDVPGNTISSVVQGQEWLSGLIGFAAVHIARRPDQKAPLDRGDWWITIAGAVIAVLASVAMDGGLVGMLLGAGAAYLTWGNSGRF